MMQLIFFAVSILAVFLGHAVFWLAVTKLLHIAAWQHHFILISLISFLFVSTIIASYLIHKWDNPFTRWYYMIAGFWIGLLVNFGLMAILILFFRLFGVVFDFTVPAGIMKFIFFGGASLVSLYGLYNAWNPQVIEYEVAIKDLPDYWNNKVVVQVSDVHLGPVYRKRFFSRLIARVDNLKPEAVFITGDLFDGMEADFSWMNHPFSKLQTPSGIYYSFGNHDLYLGFNRVISLLKENPVRILDNKMETVNGLQIIGLNYSFNSDFDLEAAILKQVNYDQRKPSILLFHAPKNVPLAKSAGIDLQLSGHTHDGQLFPFNLIAKLAHHGYGYGLFQEGDFSIIINGGAGTWGPPIRTSSRSEIVKIILKKK